MAIARIVLAVLMAVPLLAAPATALRVTLPANVTAKVPFDFTVEAIDGSGTVDTGYTGTVHFTTTSKPAFLPPDTAFTAGDAGVRTFTATLNYAGNVYITANDAANGNIKGNDWTAVAYSPDVADAFAIDVLTDPIVRNEPFLVKVTAVNHDGQKVPGYTGTVQVSVSHATILPPPYTFTPGDAGEHAFTLATSRGGHLSVRAIDQDNWTVDQSEDILVTCPDFTVSASNNGPLCRGSRVQLHAVASQPSSFWWQGPRYFIEDDGDTTSTSFAGTYTVTATELDTGCVATAQTDVEFYQPAFTTDDISGNHICGLSEYDLSLATPLTDIVWNIENGTLLSGQGTPDIRVRAANAAGGVSDISIRVSGTDPEHGCTYDDFTVATARLLQTPQPHITPAVGPYCPGMTSHADAGVLNLTWPQSWSIENGTITNQTVYGISWTPDGTGPVVLTLDVSNGTCIGSDTITIPIAAPSATVDSTPQSVCSGDAAEVSVALSGEPPFRIVWSDGVIASNIGSHSYTRTITPANDMVLSITEVSNASCTGVASGAAEIDVVQAIAIDEQPEGGRVERGARFELAVETSGATAWQWYEGETGDTSHPIDGATAETYLTPPLERTTSYWVRATSAGCGSIDSFTATVVVAPEGPGRRRSVRH